MCIRDSYVGTHRHSGEGDQPYEFTYMFKFAIDLPERATAVSYTHLDVYKRQGPAFVHYYIFYAVVGCEVDEVFVGVKVATCFEVHVGAVGCGSCLLYTSRCV